jgi:hypothetical protein
LSAVVLVTFVSGCFCQAPPQDFGDYDTELAAWLAEIDEWQQESGECGALGCPSFSSNRVAGVCNDGRTLFLYDAWFDVSGTLFFDADDGQFLGYRTEMSPDFPLHCMAGRYYPHPIQCQDGVVTKVLCGTYFEVGDPFP